METSKKKDLLKKIFRKKNRRKQELIFTSRIRNNKTKSQSNQKNIYLRNQRYGKYHKWLISNKKELDYLLKEKSSSINKK